MRPLPELLLEHPEEEPEPGQIVMINGRPERLHVALTHTCVIGPEVEPGHAGRRLVPMAAVFAGPELRWRLKEENGRWNRAASARGRIRAHETKQRPARP